MKPQEHGRTPAPESLVPLRVGADLARVKLDRVKAWVADGLVHSERINGTVYVDLDGVVALAESAREGERDASN
jgi:hypothetical protein